MKPRVYTGLHNAWRDLIHAQHVAIDNGDPRAAAIEKMADELWELANGQRPHTCGRRRTFRTDPCARCAEDASANA